MDHKVSYEEAFPTVRQRCVELFDENLILRAQNVVLSQRLDALEAPAQEPPVPTQQPMPGGPDLAAQPPYRDDDRV